MLLRLQGMVRRMKTGRSLRELFSFPGFIAGATLKGVFGDPKQGIVTLRRRKNRRVLLLRPPQRQPLRQASVPCPRPVGGRLAPARGVRALAGRGSRSSPASCHRYPKTPNCTHTDPRRPQFRNDVQTDHRAYPMIKCYP